MRYGVACYLSSPRADDRVIQAITTSDEQDLAVIDACFQRQIAERIGRFQPYDALSSRELTLLRLGAAGLHTDEMAAILHLTGHTIEFHFRNAMSKLGARNRTQAIARGTLLGLVTSEDSSILREPSDGRISRELPLTIPVFTK